MNEQQIWLRCSRRRMRLLLQTATRSPRKTAELLQIARRAFLV